MKKIFKQRLAYSVALMMAATFTATGNASSQSLNESMPAGIV